MKRNKFSLSHYKILTCDWGKLVPICWYPVNPGDTVQHSVGLMLRASPLIAPPLHPVVARVHTFFCPNRLVWDNFEDFITGGPDGNNQSVHPYIARSEIAEGSLFDYLGIPTHSGGATYNYNALPIRAYGTIFNEHYRDQDLVNETTVLKTDGLDNSGGWSLRDVSWPKDYYTTCRATEQKGPNVAIPVGNITPSGDEIPTWTATSGTKQLQALGAGSEELRLDTAEPNARHSLKWGDPKLTATGVDINDLRLALAIQRYAEARQQYGSRYVEFLRYLGVRSSDARLQNPEFLGGGRQVFSFSEVLQHTQSQSPSREDTVGAMFGHGVAALRTPRYRRFFEEHGIVMTLLSVIPKPVYMQALNRHWMPEVKEDYFQKELQYVGEQAVTNREVKSTHTTPDGIFGYQNRYDHYRWHESSVAGEMRSKLNYWHFAREYANDTALNSTFTQCVPTKRPFASQDQHVCYVLANHSIQARRMMSKYATPKTF